MTVIALLAACALFWLTMATLAFAFRARATEDLANETVFLARSVRDQLVMERELVGRAWWTTLGLTSAASVDDINAAYRAALKTVHPDLGAHGDAARIERLKRARTEGREAVARAAHRPALGLSVTGTHV